MTDDEPVSRHFVSQRLRLHYVDWGNPDAPPLILIHGGRDHCRNWDWTARALRDRYHVVAPDLRGHGDSAWSEDGDYSLWAMVVDLTMLVRHLGGGPVTIVAHSLGGNVAIRYAGLMPDRVMRLVAIEGLGLAPRLSAERDAQPPFDRLLAWIDRRTDAPRARSYATLADAEARMREANPHLDDDRIAHLTRHGVRQNANGRLAWKFDGYVRETLPVDITTPQLHALWGRITCPTLLVYGRDSWASNPATDGRLAHFQTARLALFDDAGHWVQHDRFDAFIAEVRAFLDE